MSNIYTVEIDGQQVDIEGDRPPNEAEARAALAAHTGRAHTSDGGYLRGAESIGATPWYQQNIPVGFGHQLPFSAEDAAEALPAAAATGAALLATKNPIAAGAFGGVAGEAGRQLFRRAVGAPAATGVVQRAIGADPDSPEAAVAGLAGEGVANFAAGASGEIAHNALRSRAAVQALEAIGPGKGSRKLLKVLKQDPSYIEQLGVGTRETLADRASTMRTRAGKAVEDLQNTTVPVSLQPAIDETAARAAENRIQVPGAAKPASGNPAMANALDRETTLPADLEAAYGSQVPSGEVFKLRRQIGARSTTAYDRPAGSPPPVSSAAPATMRDALSTKVLHANVPGSEATDAAYHNWNKIATRLSRAADADINARGRAAFGDYLKGRIASTAIGGGAGAVVGGLPGMAVGGLIGATLAKSAFWHSLKATTYVQLSHLVNAGNNVAAFNVLREAALAYEVSGSKRTRDAHKALQTQGEGVIAP